MFAIIGIFVVIGSIVGGFLMEKGNLAVLVQPAELVIIAGASIGTLLIANPVPVVIQVFTCVLQVLSGDPLGSMRSDEKALWSVVPVTRIFPSA